MLTDTQIRRQDEVDNIIYDMINNILPSTATKKKNQRFGAGWNMELIGPVRDAVQAVFADQFKLLTKKEFYPYL